MAMAVGSGTGHISDSHVRVSTGAAVRAAGDYTSPLGNLFVCVAAYDGAEFDVVGVGCNAFDGADVTPPSPPVGLSAAPITGGLRLQWNSVLEAGLAGYRIYWRSSAFTNPHSPGVQAVDYLEGATLHLLSLPNSSTHSVAVTAVDFSGNESALSLVVQATPLAGSPPVVELTASSPSARQAEAITLSATGALTYSFDLNGDGVVDLTNATGLANVDTTSTGLIRPLVIGSGLSGSAVALGGVSLLITGNTRPVASAQANPHFGVAPLSVNFVGLAEDLEDDASLLSYAWDFNDDGIFEAGNDTLAPPPFVYNSPGLWNVKFRATDSQGAWDVDTIAVFATPKTGTEETVVEPGPMAQQFSAAVVNGMPAVAGVDQATNDIVFRRATRADGSAWGAQVLVYDETMPVYFISLAVVAGNPALVWTNDNGDMVYCRATDALGTSWNPAQLLETGAILYYCELVDCGGMPGIGYYNADFDQAIWWRASEVNGSNWDPQYHVSTVNTAAYGVATAMIGGYPAMAYGDDGATKVYFCRATAADGSSWGTEVEANSSKFTYNVELQEIGGVPCIAFAESGTYDIYYVRAYDASGSSFYTTTQAFTRPIGSIFPDQIQLAAINDKPAVSFIDLTALQAWYVPCADPLGVAWNDPRVVAALEPRALAAGTLNSLLILGGIPGIAYAWTDSLTQTQIRLVRIYGD